MSAFQQQSNETVLAIRRNRDACSSTGALDYALSERVEAESRQEQDSIQECLLEI